MFGSDLNLSDGIPFGPLVVCFVMGWIVSSGVLNVWDMASDVIM